MPRKMIHQIPKVIRHIPEEKYLEMTTYIDIVDACSRLSHQSIFIIDYFRGNIPYVSTHLPFLYNLKNRGDDRLERNFKDYFLSMVNTPRNHKIHTAWLRFLSQKSILEKKRYSFHHSFYLLDQLVLSITTPLFFDSEGRIWLALYQITSSTLQKKPTARIFMNDSDLYWEYDEPLHDWIEKKMISLSDKEKRVIQLSLQGFTEKELGDQLHRSKDAIKSIKRKMFEKMEVSNMLEAVSYALTYHII